VLQVTPHSFWKRVHQTSARSADPSEIRAEPAPHSASSGTTHSNSRTSLSRNRIAQSPAPAQKRKPSRKCLPHCFPPVTAKTSPPVPTPAPPPHPPPFFKRAPPVVPPAPLRDLQIFFVRNSSRRPRSPRRSARENESVRPRPDGVPGLRLRRGHHEDPRGSGALQRLNKAVRRFPVRHVRLSRITTLLREPQARKAPSRATRGSGRCAVEPRRSRSRQRRARGDLLQESTPRSVAVRPFYAISALREESSRRRFPHAARSRKM